MSLLDTLREALREPPSPAIIDQARALVDRAEQNALVRIAELNGQVEQRVGEYASGTINPSYS